MSDENKKSALGEISVTTRKLRHRRAKNMVENNQFAATGKLGELLEKIRAVESAAIDFGYDERDYVPLKKARWALFEFLEKLSKEF